MPGKDARYKEYKGKFAREVLRRLSAAGIYLEGDIVRHFPSTDVRAAKGVTKRQRRLDRSQPGEIPHVDLGRLRRSIGNEVIKRKFVTRVGASTAKAGEAIDYSIFLELGTRRMAARPYLRPALDRSRRAIAQIFGKPMHIV